MSDLTVSLRHAFPGFTLDVAFDAAPGVTALFGPSGAGKSTVLSAVAGLLRPQAGRITAGGRVLFDAASRTHLAPHRRRVGVVFQDARLFPHMSVRHNLRYGLPRGGDIGAIADFLGLTPLLERRPAALSGGEQSRVAIGRALLAEPDILLMDEPLAALDAARKQEILPYLAHLRDTTRVPILYVSHALGEVAQLANQMVVLDRGRVVAQGQVDALLSDPALVPHLGVREAGAVLTGRIVAHHADGLSEVAVPGGGLWVPLRPEPSGRQLRLRIAAQDVMLALGRPAGLSALNVLSGTVAALHPGPEAGVMVQVALGGETGPRLLARITARSATALGLAPGQGVFAILKTVSVAPGDIGGIGNEGRQQDGRRVTAAETLAK